MDTAKSICPNCGKSFTVSGFPKQDLVKVSCSRECSLEAIAE